MCPSFWPKSGGPIIKSSVCLCVIPFNSEAGVDREIVALTCTCGWDRQRKPWLEIASMACLRDFVNSDNNAVRFDLGSIIALGRTIGRSQNPCYGVKRSPHLNTWRELKGMWLLEIGCVLGCNGCDVGISRMVC